MVVGTEIFTTPGVVLGRLEDQERPHCDYCDAQAIVVIKYTTYENIWNGKIQILEKTKHMCASHYDSFEFGTAMGVDFEKEWL